MYSIQGVADSATLSAYQVLDDGDRVGQGCLFGDRCLLHAAPHPPDLCITEELQQLHDLALLIRQFESALRRKGYRAVRSLQSRSPDVVGVYVWSCPMGRRHVQKALPLDTLSSYCEELDELVGEFVEARDSAA